MGETLETEPVSLAETPAKKPFRDRGYSYHKYQLKRSTIGPEPDKESPSTIADRLQTVFSVINTVGSGCFAFVPSISGADDSAARPEPPKPSKGLKHEPAVTLVPHESFQEEYDPGLDLRDPFQELHPISCCQDIFFAKAEEKACVVIDGQIHVPTVVDLTNGAPNKFEAEWKKTGVRYARFDCPDKEFALDAEDVTGTPSVLTTKFGEVCAFLDEARAAGRLPILVYDDAGMTRACALCVLYLMRANRLTLTTVVSGVERDIDPIEENIWKNRRFRMIIENNAKSLGLDDDRGGQVWKTRETFAAAIRKITG
jgi:hypothetical protein